MHVEQTSSLHLMGSNIELYAPRRVETGIGMNRSIKNRVKLSKRLRGLSVDWRYINVLILIYAHLATINSCMNFDVTFGFSKRVSFNTLVVSVWPK